MPSAIPRLDRVLSELQASAASADAYDSASRPRKNASFDLGHMQFSVQRDVVTRRMRFAAHGWRSPAQPESPTNAAKSIRRKRMRL